MKYFIDTEFIEGFKKPLFGKRRHFIDLISIGIYAEDGRTYYAVSNEFNPKDADEWVKENVIDKLEPKWRDKGIDGKRYNYSYKNNSQIAKDIIHFIHGEIKDIGDNSEFSPEFYGYYADYDWVLFCSLYGRMIDLPKGFPMFCYDLKQMLDEKTNTLQKNDFLEYFHREDTVTLKEKLKVIKRRHDYPQQENEHNALSDAKWNYDLYKFIKKLGK